MRVFSVAAICLLCWALPSFTQEKKVPELVSEINAYRAKAGLQPMTPHPQLQAAAEAHAKDMARTGRMSHTGSDGSSFVDRAKRAGYAVRSAGGEIIAGSGDPREAVQMWRGSGGHNGQMLSGRKYIGAAVAGDFACAVFFD